MALGKSGDPAAVQSLSDILNNSDEVEWLRACAAIALGRLPCREAVQPLIEALDCDCPVVCRSAVVALGDTDDDRAVSALDHVLKDQDKEELHAVAATALGKIGGDRVVPILLPALQSPNSRVKCSAALALGGMRIKEALAPFIGLLMDENESLRAVAASSLGLIGDKRAVDYLIKSLHDEAETVRAISASSLGCLNDNRAIPALEKALEDNSLNVCKQALTALSKLK
jgi:HEAT repeat protein